MIPQGQTSPGPPHLIYPPTHPPTCMSPACTRRSATRSIRSPTAAEDAAVARAASCLFVCWYILSNVVVDDWHEDSGVVTYYYSTMRTQGCV